MSESRTGEVPRTRIVHVGVTALAKEIGMTQSNITRLLQRGQTLAEIRERAAHNNMRREMKRAGVAMDKSLAQSPPVSSYVPRSRTPIPPRSTSGSMTSTRVSLVDEADEEVDNGVFAPLGARYKVPQSYDEMLAREEHKENIDAARLRRAIALADAQEIANDEKRGRLINKEQVKVWGVNFLTKAKDILTQLPGNVQDRLAAESDPVVCGIIIRDEIARALSTLYKLESLWQPPQ